MTITPSLFDQPDTITVGHIAALWRRHGCYAKDPQKIIDKAAQLANIDPHAAAELIADHDPRVITHENIPQCAGTSSSKSREDTVRSLEEALEDSASIPLLYPEPTLEDCIRLSQDLESEAGRSLAWLLNRWPHERRVSQAPALGVRDSDVAGSTCLHIGAGVVDRVSTISVWPWAEKESVSVGGVTSEQLLKAGRWFLGRASDMTLTAAAMEEA